MRKIATKGRLGLAVSIVFMLVSPVRAQPTEPLVIENVLMTTDEIAATLDRLAVRVDDFTSVDTISAVVACLAPSGLIVEAILRDPTKVVVKPTRVEVLQKGYVDIRWIGLSGAPVLGEAIPCDAKVSGVDKNKDGVLGGSTDLMKASLRCEPGFAAALGLDPTQTAENEAAFGDKVRCAGKGVPIPNAFPD